MIKKSIKMKVGVVAIAITMMTSMSVFAGTTFTSFSLELPGFNGSIYTKDQVKKTTGATGEITKFKSGAKANVDARMIDKDKDAGSWTRNLTSGNYVLEGDSTLKAGEIVRAQFSSNITTSVSVFISGEWKSN